MNKYTFELYVTDKYYVEVEARDSQRAEEMIWEMSADELKENAQCIKNVDISNLEVIKVEEQEQEYERI